MWQCGMNTESGFPLNWGGGGSKKLQELLMHFVVIFTDSEVELIGILNNCLSHIFPQRPRRENSSPKIDDSLSFRSALHCGYSLILY